MLRLKALCQVTLVGNLSIKDLMKWRRSVPIDLAGWRVHWRRKKTKNTFYHYHGSRAGRPADRDPGGD